MATAADLTLASGLHQAGAVRSVDLAGPAGHLEALLNTGSPDAPLSALVCHPHPLFGGTMHSKVVYHAMKVFNAPAFGFEFPVLRFNFRGTGASQGQHHGQDEAEDVHAAIRWLVNEYNRPVVVAGFSFGAAMAVRAACGCSQRVRSLAMLGLPISASNRDYSYPELPLCDLPKLFLSGDNDRFAPADQLKRLAEVSAEPRKLELVAGADHFFTGALAQMQTRLAGWLKEQLA